MEYDAFISYSHSPHRQLASAVHAELHRLRPGRRGTGRIFRDAPGLVFYSDPYRYSSWSRRVRERDEWSALLRALAASRWFILLASPEAAQSVSVNREVGYWLETKALDRLAVVTTATERKSDARRGQLARAVVPPALRDRVHELATIVVVDDDAEGRDGQRRLRRAIRPLAAAIYDKTSDRLPDGDIADSSGRVLPNG
jgi:hypothetical protein